MKQIQLLDGPFTGQTADTARLDGALRRFVMLWRLDNSPPAPGRPNIKDWACLYYLDGRLDVTLEGEAARPFFECGQRGRERWEKDHLRRQSELDGFDRK